MYLKTFDRAQTSIDTFAPRRSLSGEFVFISQDCQVAFLAEAAIDVLRTANRISGEAAYSWTHLSGEDALADCDGQICRPDQTLVLVGGVEAPWRPGQRTLSLLRAAIRSAARVCVVGSAVFVPLSAGVLGSKRLAVHPNFCSGFAEASNGVEIAETGVCHHKALSSATGLVTAIRMMIDLVEARDGSFIGSALARELGLQEPEGESGSNEHWRLKRMAQGDEVICSALQIMCDHLEDTLTVGQIAEILGVSQRKLERGFGERLGHTPLNIYRDLRLERAHKLLSQTTMPIGEVSVACGFSNVTLMKKWFHRKYGDLPSDVRRFAYGQTG